MTTTYELYTNENGTPKAVEGKAPAILERVEALEESLGEGVVTSVNGATGDVTPEQTGCLPLSGGTMTGNITLNTGTLAKRNVNNGYMQIDGGTDFNGGASIELRGKDAEQNAGMFYVRTTDGTNTKNLSLKPNGTFTWDNKDVLTTANGLPLSGGTMTGTVTFTVPAVINQATATSYTTIRGGTTNSDGARLVLCSKGDSDKGLFRVYAHDGTNSPYLMGTPDGILKWNNKDVVRSVNGTVADGDGNVAIDTFTAPIQKASWSLSLAENATTTKTLSGLTPRKPVFAILVGTAGNFLGPITSGAYYGFANDFGPSKSIGTQYRIFWPEGTSITIKYTGWYEGTTSKGTVTFYQ